MHRAVGAQPVDAEVRMPREELGKLPAVLERALAGRPDEEAEDLRPRPLAVPVPELDVVSLPHVGAPEESPDDEPQGKVEPRDRLRPLQDELADELVIRTVRDPVARARRFVDALAQDLERDRLPVRPVEERVDLDVRNPEPRGELRGEARLAAPARADDCDSGQVVFSV